MSTPEPNDLALRALSETLAARQLDMEVIGEAIKHFSIETPSWAYTDSGTRFKVFGQTGSARNIRQKIADAACVHSLTGITGTVAVHMLWDFAEVPIEQARQYAESLGLKIGAVNPTLFEQPEYKFGSLAHPDETVQRKALDHVADSIEAMRKVESRFLSLWLADGTNYPGQDDLRERKGRLARNLHTIHDQLDGDMELLIEYKFFEPAFYSTDIPDWGAAYLLAKQAGPRAKVLVDLGHHPLGTNIEQIVAYLIDEQMLGGFHFNSKKYADDDLTSGSMNPYELFLIFNELVAAAGGAAIHPVPFMIDQSHNIKPKIPAMIQSVMNLQETYAKALTVDRRALKMARQQCDVIAAEQVLKDAFFTDVKPLLANVRRQMDIDPDPLAAYSRSGYQEKIESERA